MNHSSFLRRPRLDEFERAYVQRNFPLDQLFLMYFLWIRFNYRRFLNSTICYFSESERSSRGESTKRSFGKQFHRLTWRYCQEHVSATIRESLQLSTLRLVACDRQRYKFYAIERPQAFRVLDPANRAAKPSRATYVGDHAIVHFEPLPQI
jgi:hypothetical protein